jgi:hypothetical protein
VDENSWTKRYWDQKDVGRKVQESILSLGLNVWAELSLGLNVGGLKVKEPSFSLFQFGGLAGLLSLMSLFE